MRLISELFGDTINRTQLLGEGPAARKQSGQIKLRVSVPGVSLSLAVKSAAPGWEQLKLQAGDAVLVLYQDQGSLLWSGISRMRGHLALQGARASIHGAGEPHFFPSAPRRLEASLSADVFFNVHGRSDAIRRAGSGN